MTSHTEHHTVRTRELAADVQFVDQHPLYDWLQALRGVVVDADKAMAMFEELHERSRLQAELLLEVEAIGQKASPLRK